MEPDRERLRKRVARVEGQVRGLQRMVEEERPCSDVLVQVAAARRALHGVALQLLDDHLRTVASRRATEATDDEPDALLRVVARLAED